MIFSLKSWLSGRLLRSSRAPLDEFRQVGHAATTIIWLQRFVVNPNKKYKRDHFAPSVPPRNKLGLSDLVDHELTQLQHVVLLELPSRARRRIVPITQSPCPMLQGLTTEDTAIETVVLLR
jgi:hypothetical protein